MACGLHLEKGHDKHWCTDCSKDPDDCSKQCNETGVCLWEPKKEETTDMPIEAIEVIHDANNTLVSGYTANLIIADEFVADEPISATEMILDKINLVSINCCVWQGRKSTTAADLAANGVDTSLLPPSTLASLGSKRIVSPEAVAPFNVIKRTAAKLCARYGVRFGNCGYAVPEEKMKELCSSLKELQQDFIAKRDAFTSEYREKVDEWIAENPPEWASIIRASADPVDHVRASLSFQFSAMKVVSPDEALENGLSDEVGNLHSQLMHEIRAMAKIAYETSFKGKTEVSQRAIRPIVAIKEKLAGMTFLGATIDDTVKRINLVLMTVDMITPEGQITGGEFDMLSGLVGNHLMYLGRKTLVVKEAIEDMSVEEEWDETPAAIVQPVTPQPTIEAITWDF